MDSQQTTSNREPNTSSLANDVWRLVCQLDAAGQLWLTELVDAPTGRTLLRAPSVLFSLQSDGPSVSASCRKRSPCELSAVWHDAQRALEVMLDLSLEAGALQIQLSAAGRPSAIRVRLPFLSELRVQPDERLPDRVIAGESSFRDARGRLVFRRVEWPLPHVRVAADNRALTCFAESDQPSLSRDPARLWDGQELMMDVTPDRKTVATVELVLHDGGWRSAFELFRRRIRARYDLSQYARPDLAWYREQLVQHFTFLYGREILDLDTGQFDLERFLDQAEQVFGGYDGMLVWGAYPRLGVDERTQWQFYDDLPGGRAGLRAIARRARERGVRFFVPFLPWDRSAALHAAPAEPDHVELARLVADVEADGVFLDTLSATSAEMRAALDEVRPGVVFCSEGRPEGAALQVITGSWDQSTLVDGAQGNWSAPEEIMPGADLWRFVFPEHRQFVTSRHAQGDDRLRVIQRGFFNATGWVVWQDIFGLALPWSTEEAALLKKCRTLLRRHRRALWSAHPTPLVETLTRSVYANEYPCERERLWILYNESDRVVDEAVLKIAPRAGCHCVDIWNDCEAGVDPDGSVHARLGPRSVGAIVELPRILSYAAQSGRVTVLQPVPGATLQARTAGSGWSVPAGAALLELRPEKQVIVVRLVSEGEVLDQIEVTG